MTARKETIIGKKNEINKKMCQLSRKNFLTLVGSGVKLHKNFFFTLK